MDPFSDPSDDAIREEELHLGDPPASRRSQLWKTALIVGIILIAAIGYGWAEGWFAPAPGKVPLTCTGDLNVTGEGSQLISPLMSVWTTGFRAYSGCVQISYQVDDGSAGLQALASRSIEFVASEAPLSPAQQAALPDPVVTVPVASGALAIIYHVPGVPAGLELSSTVLAEIFLGQITSWNSSAITALNPNMTFPAALPITTVHGSGESGSNYVFTAYLSSVSPAWSERVGQGETVNWSVGTTANGSLAMEQAVENTSGAIGFVGLNVAEGGSASVARVQNPAGNFITPTSASISAAFQDVPSNGLPLGNGDWSNVSELAAPGPESYPISTFSYVLIYEDLGHAYGSDLTKNSAGWLATFLDWLVYYAQNYSASLHFAPLPPNIIAADVQSLELLKYNGVSLLGDPDNDHD
ncbi:MAG: phosphate ABC transporter substrate-binding protein PstS [Thermoplasmata archaeon]